MIALHLRRRRRRRSPLQPTVAFRTSFRFVSWLKELSRAIAAAEAPIIGSVPVLARSSTPNRRRRPIPRPCVPSGRFGIRDLPTTRHGALVNVVLLIKSHDPSDAILTAAVELQCAATT